MHQFVSTQLIQRVDRHELNAGDAVDALFADLLRECLHHAVGTRIAIVEWIADEVAVLIKQSVVDAPGINAYRVCRRSLFDRIIE